MNLKLTHQKACDILKPLVLSQKVNTYESMDVMLLHECLGFCYYDLVYSMSLFFIVQMSVLFLYEILGFSLTRFVLLKKVLLALLILIRRLNPILGWTWCLSVDGFRVLRVLWIDSVWVNHSLRLVAMTLIFIHRLIIRRYSLQLIFLTKLIIGYWIIRHWWKRLFPWLLMSHRLFWLHLRSMFWLNITTIGVGITVYITDITGT
jgi:hypothetical protein